MYPFKQLINYNTQWFLPTPPKKKKKKNQYSVDTDYCRGCFKALRAN